MLHAGHWLHGRFAILIRNLACILKTSLYQPVSRSTQERWGSSGFHQNALSISESEIHPFGLRRSPDSGKHRRSPFLSRDWKYQNTRKCFWPQIRLFSLYPTWDRCVFRRHSTQQMCCWLGWKQTALSLPGWAFLTFSLRSMTWVIIVLQFSVSLP